MSYRISQNIYIPIAISVLCLLLSLITVWQLWNNLTTFKPAAAVMQNPPTLVAQPGLRPIEKWHLFGLYKTGLAALPTTKLQLTLEGTVVFLKNLRNSYAIIAAPGVKPKAYRVGDSVPGGAVLRKVFRSRVVIDNNGNLENLLLPIPKLTPQQQAR